MNLPERKQNTCWPQPLGSSVHTSLSSTSAPSVGVYVPCVAGAVSGEQKTTAKNRISVIYWAFRV